MATVTVRRSGRTGFTGTSALVLVVFRKRGYVQLRFPWIPDEVQRDNVAAAFEQIPRPGRRPLLVNTGRSLATLQLTVELSYRNGAPVQPLIDDLVKYAGNGRPVIAYLGPRMLGLAQITGLSPRETAWNRSGRATEAVCDLELTQFSAAAPVVGPVPNRKKKKKKR